MNRSVQQALEDHARHIWDFQEEPIVSTYDLAKHLMQIAIRIDQIEHRDEKETHQS